MAIRPVFFSDGNFVKKKDVKFAWFPGFSATQAKKNVLSMHASLDQPCLEVSTKSELELGISLSAFSLKLKGNCLESVYQASKRFSRGGPYKDIARLNPREAKSDKRLWKSGQLVGFEMDGVMWSLYPKSSFYDYLYIETVRETISPNELRKILAYMYYSDIHYNPQRMISTQARSVAICKLLLESYGELPAFKPEQFLAFHKAFVKC